MVSGLASPEISGVPKAKETPFEIKYYCAQVSKRYLEKGGYRPGEMQDEAWTGLTLDVHPLAVVCDGVGSDNGRLMAKKLLQYNTVLFCAYKTVFFNSCF